jgi:hypothetical protein
MPKKNGYGGGLRSSPLWIIASHKNKRMEVFTIDLDDYIGGSFLAVFTFEEEVQAFLGLLEDERKEWSVRQTTPGELISILQAPYAKVQWVALDPLPLPFGRAMLPYISEVRELFIERVMEERRQWTRRELVPA